MHWFAVPTRSLEELVEGAGLYGLLDMLRYDAARPIERVTEDYFDGWIFCGEDHTPPLGVETG